MKRVSILVLICVFCLAGTVLAKDEKEIGKGSILVGGASTFGLLFGNHTIKPEGEDPIKADTTSFNLTGYGGYFIMTGIEVGPILGINYGKVEVDEDAIKTTASMTQWDIGVQGAYIWNPGRKKEWAPFGMLALEYVTGNLESEYEMPLEDKQKTDAEISGWSITPRGGIMVFLTKRFALDASFFIKYVSADGSTKNDEKQKFDLTSTNYGIMIGFNGFLN